MSTKHLFSSVLDAFLDEISRRFDQKNIETMHAIQVCNPQSQSFLYLLCSPLLGFIILTRKLSILKQSWQSEHLVGQKEDLQHTCDVFLSLIPLKDAFPEINQSSNDHRCEYSSL